MSVNEKSLTAMVWQRCPSKYSGTQLVALLKLAGLCAQKGHAFVRVPVLATMCGVSERAIQKTLKQLRKDGLLAVKYRKGRSSLITVNVEEVQKLPLVLPDRTAEQPKAEQAAQPGELAQTLANAFRNGVLKLPNAQVADDWQSTWPVQFQKLVDAGHSEQIIRQAARFGLKWPHFSDDFAKTGVHALVTRFSELMKRLEKEQAA